MNNISSPGLPTWHNSCGPANKKSMLPHQAPRLYPRLRLTYYNAEYDKLIAQGLAANPATDQPAVSKRGRPQTIAAQNLPDRLQTHKSWLWPLRPTSAFLLITIKPNGDVRTIKVKQKVSGAFRTTDGADTFCALRSYISTARKQGLNAIDALLNAFLAIILSYPQPTRLSSYSQS
ncbi:MAG: hypothetical protein R3A44_09455 [Caldilineaceae bacterium]